MIGMRIAQGVVIGVIAFGLYTMLYSKLPIDDTSRFTQSVAEGFFEWDATHLFMQPATVLWHRYIDWSNSALLSQHHINSAAAAVSLSLLFYLTTQFKLPVWERFTLVCAAGSGFFLINLATSGHMKLVALPFLTLSLLAATQWELTDLKATLSRWQWLIVSAVSLAVATLCLANSIFILPFQFLVLMAFGLQKGESWRNAIRTSIVYTTIVVLIVFSTLGFVFLRTHDSASVSLTSFKEFLVEKENENATLPVTELKERVFRLAYGTVLNFVYIENLGPILKAKLRGQFPEAFSMLPLIARDLIFAGITSASLACIFAWSGLLVWRRQAGIGAASAAVLGILTFAAYWNLAEADFYYQLTIPTYLMLCQISTVRIRTMLGVALCSASLVANVALWAIPKAQYPFDRYVSQLQNQFGRDDLIVAFRAYPGKQCMAFFLPHLADRPRILVDELASAASDKAAFFSELSKRLRERPYQKIVLFGILDPLDFNAPIPKIWQMGLTKHDLEKFFEQHGEVKLIAPIAELPCWELKIPRDHL